MLEGRCQHVFVISGKDPLFSDTNDDREQKESLGAG
jgi:hypothetical protein